MASIVSKHIMSILCSNQGCLDFRQLQGILGQSFTVDEKLLRNVLSDGTNFVLVEDREKCAADAVLSPGTMVVAKTSLRICKNQDKCLKCDELHLCRYLVCGKCKFGIKCKSSHDLESPHNSGLLKKHNLFLKEELLFSLLLQNDPSLVPEVCSHYNKGNGEHGSCKYQASCTNLHLCQHFLQDDCKFGASCKRNHSFDATAIKNLNGRGFSPQNIRNLHKIYKNRFLLTGHSERPLREVPRGAEKVSSPVEYSRQRSSNSVSEADRNEICLYFVRKGCSFKEKCVRVHHELPYKWEILEKDGVTWTQLPNEEDIEKAYCNPANDCSSRPLSVNFTTMTYGGSPVRRLSTSSSVTKPPHFILTTEWLWYWENENGVWTEYGQGADSKNAPITSKILENLYIAEVETEIPFSLGRQDYVLSLKDSDLYQRNIRTLNTRLIRRRPRYVSSLDVKGKLNSDTPENPSSLSVDVPAHWDKGSLPSFSYKVVPVSKSAADYKTVNLLFKRTLPSSTVHSIKRVQNISLWRVFQWQKEQMMMKSGRRGVDERYLFHGTSPALVDAICEQNFDWRICGVHGSLYGKGSYFARDAKYSDKYAVPCGSTRTKMMFVALVLVGEFTRGSSSYLRPPPRKDKQGFYDSCVDNESNPAIFVIFEKFQIYPEYIIEYS